jgi:Outer membrane protein beta-barrel domain
MLKQAGAVLVSLLFLTPSGLAQDNRFDFSLNGAGVFTKQSSGNGITQTATDGGGGFATIRVRFNPKHSFVFNYGRYKNSQIYQSIDNFHVLASISEYSFAYMFTPFTKGRWEPFLLAGVGAIRFSPNSTWVFFPPLPGNIPNNIQVNLNASKQTELGVLYGLGVDYRIPTFTRFAIRLQYRGILYKEPDFNIDASHGSDLNFFTGAKGHMAEPSVGIVYRF